MNNNDLFIANNILIKNFHDSPVTYLILNVLELFEYDCFLAQILSRCALIPKIYFDELFFIGGRLSVAQFSRINLAKFDLGFRLFPWIMLKRIKAFLGQSDTQISEDIDD